MGLFLSFFTNPVCLSIIVITVLSLSKLSIPLTLVVGTLTAGFFGGMPLGRVIQVFSEGISGGVNIALSYAFLGMFAAGLTAIGIPEFFASKIANFEDGCPMKTGVRRAMLFLFFCGIASQTIIPVHIAFIPIIVPAFLSLFNGAKVDRRAVACILTFGLVGTYTFLPFGFGGIFLREVVLGNLQKQGIQLALSNFDTVKLMFIPTAGMILGLIFAVCVSYGRPRSYEKFQIEVKHEHAVSKGTMLLGALAMVTMLTVQIIFKSMVVGAFSGVMVLLLSGALKWKNSDKIVTKGFGMMATIGMTMIIASGFSAVLSCTGAVNNLVSALLTVTSNNMHLTILLMLVVGLIITMGIGSSFSTVPILAAILVPICQRIGLSAASTFITLAVAGALGDAGSVASDSTLGPTTGLNVDGQHDHFKDSVIPTFLHFNIPLLIFGYIAIILFS
ncbi:MAG: hypothetical protein LBS87_01920 [Puniceicoccales bacterium]|jgi:predicted histidine transporter YuiF (NhaC family)|nr:hypothetical protein [Puniceicoccales bacterium]